MTNKFYSYDHNEFKYKQINVLDIIYNNLTYEVDTYILFVKSVSSNEFDFVGK